MNQLTVFLASILNLAIAGFVFTRNTKNDLNRWFSIFSLNLALWNFFAFLEFTAPNPQLALLWSKLLNSFILLIPLTFAGFIFAFQFLGNRKTLFLLLLTLTVPFLLSIWTTTLFVAGVMPKYSLNYFTVAGPLFKVFAIYFLSTVVIVNALLFVKMRKESGLRRIQFNYLLLALGVGFLVGSLGFVATFWRFRFPVIGNIGSLLYVSIVAYAILRHRLLDIEVIIRRGFIYSTLVAITAGVYASAIFLAEPLLKTFIPNSRFVAILIASVFVAAGFKAIEGALTNFTDRYFFRKKYNYQHVLKEWSEALTLLTDIDRLGKLVSRIVARTMRIKCSALLVLDPKSARYSFRGSEGEMKPFDRTEITMNHPLVEYLNKRDTAVILEEIEHLLNTDQAPKGSADELRGLRDDMKKYHAAAAIPSYSRPRTEQRRMVAILLLGEKLSGDPYTSEDISLLASLSNQGAVAVENSLMYEDLKDKLEKLQQAQEQLLRSEKLSAVGTMAASIAHEIKNPLSSMKLFTEMLPKRFSEENYRKKFYDVMIPEIDRLDRIVNGLLTFARPSPPRLEPTDINATIDKTLTIIGIQIKHHNIKIRKSFGEVPRILGDAAKLMQVFMNLFQNAIHAMPDGGEISVESHTTDHQIIVRVKDTGTGISPEKLPKVFDPFFTTKDTGTGLGLSITHQIITDHKGSISVQSEVGRGAEFTIQLPVQ